MSAKLGPNALFCMPVQGQVCPIGRRSAEVGLAALPPGGFGPHLGGAAVLPVVYLHHMVYLTPTLSAGKKGGGTLAHQGSLTPRAPQKSTWPKNPKKESARGEMAFATSCTQPMLRTPPIELSPQMGTCFILSC
jgi:hypothetical protein